MTDIDVQTLNANMGEIAKKSLRLDSKDKGKLRPLTVRFRKSNVPICSQLRSNKIAK